MRPQTTLVAIGCSKDRDYHFLLPLTCLLWREHIGLTPFAFLVGKEEEWHDNPKLRTVRHALGQHLITKTFIEPVAGYPDHTTAQNVRQHAAAVSFVGDNDWVMPADADLWPLRPEFYHQHGKTNHKAVCYYANGDHFQGKEDVLERAARGLCSQTIPTCHVAMQAADWRTIYGLKVGDVHESIKKTLDGWMSRRATSGDHGMALWMSDQQIMTEALCQQNWFPQAALLIPRKGHPPVDRLDRSHAPWPVPFDASKWTDAHMHKGPDTPAYWADALRIIEAVLPEHAEWARRYYDDYASAS